MTNISSHVLARSGFEEPTPRPEVIFQPTAMLREGITGGAKKRKPPPRAGPSKRYEVGGSQSSNGSSQKDPIEWADLRGRALSKLKTAANPPKSQKQKERGTPNTKRGRRQPLWFLFAHILHQAVLAHVLKAHRTHPNAHGRVAEDVVRLRHVSSAAKSLVTC